MGVSPRNRARLTGQLERLFEEDNHGRGLESSSEILKLQMIALAGYKEEVDTLKDSNLNLEAEITRLLETVEEEKKWKTRIMEQILHRRGNNLKSHGEFLLTLTDT